MPDESTRFSSKSLHHRPPGRNIAGVIVCRMTMCRAADKVGSFFRFPNWLRFFVWPLCLGFGLAISALRAAEHHGKVNFGGLPVPGATVTAAQGDKKLVAITDPDGNYSFPDLPDGAWTLQVEMLGFEPLRHEANIAADAAIPDADL